MTPTTRCKNCGLVQFDLQTVSNMDGGRCRRCRAQLGFAVSQLALDSHSGVSGISSVAGLLVSLRRRRHASQLTISRIAGLERSQISRYEAGSAVPNLATFLRLLRGLGVTALYLRQSDQN